MGPTWLFGRSGATYSQKTSAGIGMLAIYLLFVFVFAYSFTNPERPDDTVSLGALLYVIGAVALGYSAIRTIQFFVIRAQLKRHAADLAALSAQHGYQFRTDAYDVATTFQGSSLLALPEQDSWLANAVTAEDWQYVEFSYPIYRKNKYGQTHVETVYYGVICAHLPRRLPHVFFDSLRARGRQFRWIFTRDQKHSLEGDFDQHFITYFPPNYTIDGLSFITPEVMWALKEASDYDIEIVDDRLYLYAPIYDDENRLHDMAAKLKTIKEKLLHNITTYRDERLSGATGRMTVSAEGARLKRSQLLQRIAAIFAIVYIVLYFWFQFQKMLFP